MFTTIQSKFASYLNRYSIAKTRHLLLGMDDDLLARASISRELLLRGVEYWPWQTEAGNSTVTDSVIDISGQQKPAAAAVDQTDAAVASSVEEGVVMTQSLESVETPTEKAA